MALLRGRSQRSDHMLMSGALVFGCGRSKLEMEEQRDLGYIQHVRPGWPKKTSLGELRKTFHAG